MKTRTLQTCQRPSNPRPKPAATKPIEWITWSKRRKHVCVCGASSLPQDMDDVFMLCDEVGRLIRTDREIWPRPLVRCMECGRIVDLGTFAVVGRGPIGWGW